MKKMYIAVLDEAPDYMVPTLVAHSVMAAHEKFSKMDSTTRANYYEWYDESFRKVVVRVGRKVFDKIRTTLVVHEGHENTICNAEPSCLVVLPVDSANVPKVLQYCTLWKPDTITPPLPEPIQHPAHISDNAIADNLPEYVKGMIDSIPHGLDHGQRSTIHQYAEILASIRIGYWRVSAGDTLSHIAMYTGTDWHVLAKINELQNPDLIFPGQLIKLR